MQKERKNVARRVWELRYWLQVVLWLFWLAAIVLSIIFWIWGLLIIFGILVALSFTSLRHMRD